jgi:hypothetical protein
MPGKGLHLLTPLTEVSIGKATLQGSVAASIKIKILSPSSTIGRKGSFSGLFCDFAPSPENSVRHTIGSLLVFKESIL